MNAKYWLFLVCVPLSVHADRLVVMNGSDTDLYSAIYYRYRFVDTVNRASDIILIQKNDERTAKRPLINPLADRDIVFSHNPFALKQKMTKAELASLVSVNIGSTADTVLVVKEDSGKLIAATPENTLNWKKALTILARGGHWALKQAKSAGDAVVITLSAPFKNKLRNDLIVFKNNPYSNQVARVRLDNALPEAETICIKKRLAKAREVFQRVYKKPVLHVPKIAIIGSGGGYRAMICTYGFLTGLEEIGLFDATTWMTALSGSTWAVSTFMAKAKKHYDEFGVPLPVFEAKESLFDMIADKDINQISNHEIALLRDALLVDVASDQPITLVNVYGALLANRLLAFMHNKRHQVYLHDQQDYTHHAFAPIPIYTAVRGESGLKKESLEWYEFTPWEIGGAWLKAYIPSWAFGRTFSNGVSLDTNPPRTLGFDMGTFGSAFAASIGEIYATIQENIGSAVVNKLLQELLVNSMGKQRLSWAEINNFAKNIPQIPISDRSSLRMVDGGLAFNLPYPPVSGERPERKADVLIFLDASLWVKEHKEKNQLNELRGVEAYARRKGLKFPPINWDEIGTKAVSIFKDDTDPEVPLVIYMARINDPSLLQTQEVPNMARFMPAIKTFDVEQCTSKDVCDTFNFKYSFNQMDSLSKVMHFNVVANRTRIFDAIGQWIDKKAAVARS